MNFTPITSSNLRSGAIDGSDMYLEFVSGGVYRYEGVPESVFNGLMGAESAGKFFHAEIKDKYPCTKIDVISN